MWSLNLLDYIKCRIFVIHCFTCTVFGGFILNTKIRTLAILKKRDEALKELEKAGTAPVTKQYKEKFASEEYKKEILSY